MKVKTVSLPQKTAKKEDQDRVRSEVLAALQKEDRRLPWLSQKIDVSYHTLYSYLVTKVAVMPQECLDKINKLFGTSIAYNPEFL